MAEANWLFSGERSKREVMRALDKLAADEALGILIYGS
jgi:hypothetical protein